MLGDSSGTTAVLGSSSSSGADADAATTTAVATTSHEAGGVASNSGVEDDNNKSRVDEGDRGFGGGNRWPRQETISLLQIRSDMDVAFRDANVKAPLWEEVSRKLAELGYHRSAKKCKEKFENVYKYHKRTKEGRTGKSEGKAYRFFDQLEALENHPPISSPPTTTTPPQPPKPQNLVAATLAMPVPIPPCVSHITVPSTTVHGMSQNIVTPTINLTIPSFPPTNPTILPPPPPPPPPTTNPTNPSHSVFPSSLANMSTDLLSNSTSSSTSSDVELEGRRKRKRKWKDFFQRLMKEVIQTQEDLQKRFLEAIEKREHERMVREEAWRMQEMARINREREILAQERSIAAAKDAAVMAFLQKLSEQQNPGQAQNNQPKSQPPPPAPAPPPPQPAPPLPVVSAPPPPPPPLSQAVVNLDTSKTHNGDQNFMSPSPSRWPKVEVQALIRLRTNLDSKYQETGPKGPLWEEISAGMRKLGYNRNAKRCKEKWENINKYFKKVKESNKIRPEDSKTCPYFHLLEALYKEKHKFEGSTSNQVKPENSVPLMVRPEQQWPPQPEHRPDSVMEDIESEQNQDDDNDDDDDKDGDFDEEDEGGGFEIVANKPVSMDTNE